MKTYSSKYNLNVTRPESDVDVVPIIFSFGYFFSDSNQLRFARSPFSKTMLKIDQDVMSLSVSHDVKVDDMLNFICEEDWSIVCWAKTITFLVYRYFIG